MTRKLLPMFALAVVGLWACDAEEVPETQPGLETAPAAPAAPITATPEPAAGSAGAAVVSVAEAPEYGSYLTDGTGRALYLLEEDAQGESVCYDACAEAWPPFLAPQGAPTAGDAAVQAGMLGTLTRRDGSVQVTYDGHPLYYYAEDQGPGQATGQDVTDEWGEWYLVTPEGGEVEG